MKYFKRTKILIKKPIRKVLKSKEKPFFIAFFIAGQMATFGYFKFNEAQHKSKLNREIASMLPSSDDVTSVTVRDVEKRDLIKSFTAYSTLKPLKEIVINPEAKVNVGKILVKSGQRVKKGQVLVILDSESLRLRKELASIEFNVKKSEYELTSVLAEKDYVSKNELNQKRLDYKSDQIKQQLEEINGGAGKIIAPFDGIVADINMHEGDFIDEPNKYSIKVIDNNRYKVDLFIPQSVAYKIKKNQVAFFENDEGKKMHAKVLNIAPTIDAQTGTVYVEVVSQDSKIEWLSGIFVNVKIQLEKAPKAMAIKSHSVLYEKGKPYAYRVVANEDQNIAQKVNLQLGISDGEFVEVKSGLSELDQLIVEGQSELKDQAKIDIFSIQK